MYIPDILVSTGALQGLKAGESLQSVVFVFVILIGIPHRLDAWPSFLGYPMTSSKSDTNIARFGADLRSTLRSLAV